MILLFSSDAEFGAAAAKELREHGLPAASHDPDFLLSICRQIDFCGVILDGRQKPRAFETLSEQLFACYPDAPILFLAPSRAVLQPCASKTICADEADLSQVLLHFAKNCIGSENYATYALQYHETDRKFTYLGYSLILSDYERRFLLYLLRCAPNAVRTDDLLSEAFPNANTPKSTLCTLAKRINQAARDISGLNLVQSVYGIGYRLCDGIVARHALSALEKGDIHDTKTEKRASAKN